MSRKGKTILVRDSSTQTRIKKVSVEYPCDNREEDLNVVINNEDFFGNLSISNDKHNHQKRYHQKLVTPAVSMTSTGASVSPDSGGTNYMPEYLDDEDDDVNYEDVYFDDFSPGPSDDGIVGLASDDEDRVPGAVGYAGNDRYDFNNYAQSMEEVSNVRQKKYKNGTRSSLTFSNDRVREIDRDNQILLEKIMKKGSAPPTTSCKEGKPRKHFSRNDTFDMGTNVKSSAEVNRKKQQKKIDHDNQILQRKLQNISQRKKLVTFR